MAKKEPAKKQEAADRKLVITAPAFQEAAFRIVGTTPYVQHRLSAKEQDKIRRTQEAGSTAKKGTKKAPKDFQALYEAAMYRSPEGWHGIPAAAFRDACVSACKLCGFAMTRAKLTIFCEADGFDAQDGKALVRITKGKPRYSEAAVRNQTGVIDLRARPLWPPGWEATVRLRFDSHQFTLEDVANLIVRVGLQVGIGDGRADSPKSSGVGWGFFAVANRPE